MTSKQTNVTRAITNISILIAGSLFVTAQVWAACTGAAPTFASTPDRASVADCVDRAPEGSRINVAAGTATWNLPITITKGLRLIGAGRNAAGAFLTKISGNQGHILYQPANYDLNSQFRVSGFEFNLANGLDTCVDLGNFQGRRIPYAPFKVQTRIRIDHNRFLGGQVNSTQSHAFKISLSAVGVADNNDISGFRLPIDGNGGVSGTGPNYGGRWVYDNLDMTYADPLENFYFEDNVMDFGHAGEADASLTQCEYAGRYALRYNDISSKVKGQPILDLHGNSGYSVDDAMYSCYGGVLYGNKVTATGYWLNHRGGKFLSFYNSFANPSAIYPTNEYSDLQLPATKTKQYVHDTYYWNNRMGNGTGALLPVSIVSQVQGVPNFNKEIFTDAEGQIGVRCGTRAQRPGTCSFGQGYWETTQSCTNTTNLVGAVPDFEPNRNPTRLNRIPHPTNGKIIDGQLFVCSAPNTWSAVAKYIPLAYPHPLRSTLNN